MTRNRLVWLGLYLLLFISGGVAAADNPVRKLEIGSSYEAALVAAPVLPAAPHPAVTLSADEMTHQFRMLEERHKLYEILILSLLALSSLFIVLRFITAKPAYSPSDIVNVTGMIFIIFGTIMLVIMVKTDEQLTASVGILGAIAGYLFGTMKTSRPGQGSDRKE